MIKITVEKIPLGDERKSVVIASGLIWNDLTGGNLFGNYHYRLFTKSGKVFKEGCVYNHRRTNSVWELVKSCLTK